MGFAAGFLFSFYNARLGALESLTFGSTTMVDSYVHAHVTLPAMAELGIDIMVHHLPPGTSKWNKIEHRLFSFISMNWRARPLVSYRVIVDLISATTTETGLTVRCSSCSTSSTHSTSFAPSLMSA